MSENSENNLFSKRNSSNIEINRSSPNLNIKSDGDEVNIHKGHKNGVDDTSQSISKSQQAISTSISMQDSQAHNGNIDKTATVLQSEQGIDESSLSASFKQLSRRESSLENLTEDNGNTQVNVSASEVVVTYFVQKTDVNDSFRDFTRKNETSSRFRRTMHSLFSCCSSKRRRSLVIEKTDGNIEGVSELETDKCANVSLGRRTMDKEHTSFNCLRLRKFFDMLDESELNARRVQPIRQILPSVPYRDGDKNDSPSRKSGDNLQPENGGANLTRPVLLGPIKIADQGKKCFIIDLDETLVHSSFKMVDKADFKVGVDIEGTVHTVYVLKRPYVDVFLQKMGRIFECVLFTASLAKYADPVTDFLDKWRVFRWRLFRESCVFHRGNYVKDLGMLGRLTDQIVILDNSPASYMFHPDSAVQITSWFDDPKDTALLDLIPYFEQLAQAPSVPSFLSSVKPPQRATVPVSVMIPLPNLLPLPSVSQNSKLLEQSSSPISSVVSSVPIIEDMSTSSSTSTSTKPCIFVANSDILQLPFSRCQSPAAMRTFAKSLSSLSTGDDSFTSVMTTRTRNLSRSEGSLGMVALKEPMEPLIVRTFCIPSHQHQSRLSKSVSDLPKLLILQENLSAAPFSLSPQCISSSSPILMVPSSVPPFLSVPSILSPSTRVTAHGSAPLTPVLSLSSSSTTHKSSSFDSHSKLSVVFS